MNSLNIDTEIDGKSLHKNCLPDQTTIPHLKTARQIPLVMNIMAILFDPSICDSEYNPRHSFGLMHVTCAGQRCCKCVRHPERRKTNAERESAAHGNATG